MRRWITLWLPGLLLLVVGISRAESDDNTEERKQEEVYMAEGTVEYPSFSEMEYSPDLESEGIGINVRQGVVRDDKGELRRTAFLYGSYAAGNELWNRCGAQPYTWIIVTVVRRDRPGIWSKTIEDASYKPVPPEPSPPEEPGPIDELTIGYFNLDLGDFFPLPKESAKYWVVAWFGNYMSEKHGFEIVVDEDR